VLVSVSCRSGLLLELCWRRELQRAGKARDGEDAIASTFATANPSCGGRDARAPQTKEFGCRVNGNLASIMPAPVMGAIIVFLASFMIVSSLQIILSSKPDTRKTFVIGIPLIFGLSLQALPELYAQIVPWLRPLFGSALTLATVLAVVLNLLLRIGGAKQDEAPT